MVELDWERLGQGLAAIGALVVGIFAWAKGQAKSNGQPPPERPPMKDEVKAALDELRADITRLHAKIDRHGEITADEWRELTRQLDRIEAAQRLESAMMQWKREEKGK